MGAVVIVLIRCRMPLTESFLLLEWEAGAPLQVFFFFFCVQVNETGSGDGLWMPEDARSSYGNRECLHSVGCCHVTEHLDATGGRARINICVCPRISNHRETHGR